MCLHGPAAHVPCKTTCRGACVPRLRLTFACQCCRAALLRLAAHTLDSADRAVLLAALMQATTCMQQSAAAQESLPQQQATSSGSAALQQVWAAGLASLLSCTTYVAAVAGGGQPQPCVTAQIQRAVQVRNMPPHHRRSTSCIGKRGAGLSCSQKHL